VHEQKNKYKGAIAMFKYNDCLKMTRSYLRNYVGHQQAVKTITEDVEGIKAQLAGVGGMTASYGQRGGFQELDAIEGAAEKRRDLRLRAAILLGYRDDLMNHLDRLELAIRRLSMEEREAVKLHFEERKSYREMAEEIHLSERSCRRRVSGAVRGVAGFLFGELAEKEVWFGHG